MALYFFERPLYTLVRTLRLRYTEYPNITTEISVVVKGTYMVKLAIVADTRVYFLNLLRHKQGRASANVICLFQIGIFPTF